MSNDNYNPAELRFKAITWWNELTEEERNNYFSGYKKWTPATASNGLTGREIQNIWAVAMNPPDPKPVINSLSATIEGAAVDYISESSARSREYGMVYSAILFGSNFRKEQDKVLIAELYNALDIAEDAILTSSIVSANDKRFKDIQSAISKAKEFLSK